MKSAFKPSTINLVLSLGRAVAGKKFGIKIANL